MSAAQFCRKENIDQKYFSTCKRRLIKKSKAVSSIFTQVKIKQTITQDIVFEYQHKNSTIKFNQLFNEVELIDDTQQKAKKPKKKKKQAKEVRCLII